MRIQFDLPDHKLKQLRVLMNEAGLNTYKELISNAITLLGWAVREKRAGRTIASIDEKQLAREILLPALDNVESRRESAALALD